MDLLYVKRGRGIHMGKNFINNDVMNPAIAEMNKLEDMLNKIDNYLKYAPNGSLKCHKKDGHTYYYNAYMEKDSDNKDNIKWKSEYIKKDSLLAKELANKQYYTSLKLVIENNLKQLKRFVSKYQENKIDEIYDSLSKERKRLVTPLQLSIKEQVRIWDEEEYEINNSYPENLRYETEQGDIVRSKSEVIIANILYKHRKDILYKYEKPLSLIVNGREKIVYPDFTIINIHTGKITYWEHAGLMGDEGYATDFVRKINSYVANGLMLGKDIVVSYETEGVPLDIGVVKKMLEEIIK